MQKLVKQMYRMGKDESKLGDSLNDTIMDRGLYRSRSWQDLPVPSSPDDSPPLHRSIVTAELLGDGTNEKTQDRHHRKHSRRHRNHSADDKQRRSKQLHRKSYPSTSSSGHGTENLITVSDPSLQQEVVPAVTEKGKKSKEIDGTMHVSSGTEKTVEKTSSNDLQKDIHGQEADMFQSSTVNMQEDKKSGLVPHKRKKHQRTPERSPERKSPEEKRNKSFHSEVVYPAKVKVVELQEDVNVDSTREPSAASRNGLEVSELVIPLSDDGEDLQNQPHQHAEPRHHHRRHHHKLETNQDKDDNSEVVTAHDITTETHEKKSVILENTLQNEEVIVTTTLEHENGPEVAGFTVSRASRASYDVRMDDMVGKSFAEKRAMFEEADDMDESPLLPRRHSFRQEGHGDSNPLGANAVNIAGDTRRYNTGKEVVICSMDVSPEHKTDLPENSGNIQENKALPSVTSGTGDSQKNSVENGSATMEEQTVNLTLSDDFSVPADGKSLVKIPSIEISYVEDVDQVEDPCFIPLPCPPRNTDADKETDIEASALYRETSDLVQSLPPEKNKIDEAVFDASSQIIHEQVSAEFMTERSSVEHVPELEFAAGPRGEISDGSSQADGDRKYSRDSVGSITTVSSLDEATDDLNEFFVADKDGMCRVEHGADNSRVEGTRDRTNKEIASGERYITEMKEGHPGPQRDIQDKIAEDFEEDKPRKGKQLKFEEKVSVVDSETSTDRELQNEATQDYVITQNMMMKAMSSDQVMELADEENELNEIHVPMSYFEIGADLQLQEQKALLVAMIKDHVDLGYILETEQDVDPGAEGKATLINDIILLDMSLVKYKAELKEMEMETELLYAGQGNNLTDLDRDGLKLMDRIRGIIFHEVSNLVKKLHHVRDKVEALPESSEEERHLVDLIMYQTVRLLKEQAYHGSIVEKVHWSRQKQHPVRVHPTLG